MAKGRGDQNARRPGESHFEWRGRIAAQMEAERTKGEEAATPEGQKHGLKKGWIIDDEGNMQNAFTRQSRSALAYMRERGSITDDQFAYAMEIASIAEMIERSVATSGASMEARVDCSGSAKDQLHESLYRVRAEGAYTEWRSKLPLPRRMVIDMVTRDAGLAAIASEHNMGWPRARTILINALDAWPDILAKYVRRIDQDDLDRQHARLRA